MEGGSIVKLMGEVTLTNVSKLYDGVRAVEDVNLKVNDGEFLTLVGPSGCGKSTTLHIIAGLTQPTNGTVEIDGLDVTDLPPKDRNMAMVFQNIALFPHMNVFENMAFGLRLHNYDRGAIENRVASAAKKLQIESLLDREPTELSGGQQQRVAIGRAIVREPEVFLMDEPLANLDAKLRVHMRTELQRLHKELNTTIIYVTHDQAEAMTMSDRVAVFNDGRHQQIADPLICYNTPANDFVGGFMGSPAMNFMEAEVRSNRLSTPWFELKMDFDRNPHIESVNSVQIGVRPEDIYLFSEREQITFPSDKINTYTDVIEPMGNETIVYMFFDRGNENTFMKGEKSNELLMSVNPDTEISDNSEIDIVLDLEKVHLFEGDSGEAIAHGIRSISDDHITEPTTTRVENDS